MKNIHNKILLSTISSFLLVTNELNAFDFGSFFNTVKTGATQFVQSNPYAQNIYNNTKQQAALATQGFSGNLQQYGQEQGQQIGQQASGQRPENFSQGLSYLEKTVKDFGKGAWNNVQTVNQGITENTPMTQKISLMKGSLSGAIQMNGPALQAVMLPIADNGTSISLWYNDAQSTLSLLGQTNPEAGGGAELINMAQNQVKGIPTLAYKQQSGGMLMPGNVNWDYLVDSNGTRYSPEGNPLGTRSPSYSDDQNMLIEIEKKRYSMRNLCVKIYNILILNGAQLSEIDQNLPLVILSTLQNLGTVGPTEQNADYYIKLATDQITAAATLLKYSGQVRPVDNSWSILVDRNGNRYSGNGLALSNSLVQQSTPVTNQFNSGFNAAPTSNQFSSVGQSNSGGFGATSSINQPQSFSQPTSGGFNAAPTSNQFSSVGQSNSGGFGATSSINQPQSFSQPTSGGFNAAPASNQFSSVGQSNSGGFGATSSINQPQSFGQPTSGGFGAAPTSNQFSSVGQSNSGGFSATSSINQPQSFSQPTSGGFNAAPTSNQFSSVGQSNSGGFGAAPAGYRIPD